MDKTIITREHIRDWRGTSQMFIESSDSEYDIPNLNSANQKVGSKTLSETDQSFYEPPV